MEAQMPSTDIWRVYLPEYLIVYTSKACGNVGIRECMEWFHEHYEGKVSASPLVESMIVDSRVKFDNRQQRLKVKLPNLRGEFVEHTDAERMAEELGPDAVVVARFSREERKVRDYGRRKLAR